MNSLTMWHHNTNEIVPQGIREPAQVIEYAVQLAQRDRRQIVAAFDARNYEMGLLFLWEKTALALKKELSSVGVGLLAEMLGRTEVDDDEDVENVLTHKDSIRIAEELGVVNRTDAMRLRHAYEMISHFSRLDAESADSVEIEEAEALTALMVCVRSVLGRPKIEVARKFVEFRDSLQDESLKPEDKRVEMLKGSPYFFKKLTINVLLNGARKNVGANLEHTLANINTLIPVLWGSLRDAEKWQVGHCYAEAYNDGRSTIVSGVKSALLKVQGFDFVPENIRSETFLKAAEAVLRAHDGLNNFHNEPVQVKALMRLGSVIPTFAIPACVTALICVFLGNRYGNSWAAESDALEMLKAITKERWAYFVNQVLPTEVRILNKLVEEQPSARWIKLVSVMDFKGVTVKDKLISKLLLPETINRPENVQKTANAMIVKFYGRAG
jgi:hypothetical protein